MHSFSEFEPDDHIQAKRAFNESFMSDVEFSGRFYPELESIPQTACNLFVRRSFTPFLYLLHSHKLRSH